MRELTKEQIENLRFVLTVGANKDWKDEANALCDMALRSSSRDAGLEEAARVCESFGRAHTYASENADHYRGFDAGTEACAKRIRALKRGDGGSAGEKPKEFVAGCQCYCCIEASGVKVNGWPLTMTRMVVCPKCGNKRCPHGTYHGNACTDSNDPGQPGSRYTLSAALQGSATGKGG